MFGGAVLCEPGARASSGHCFFTHNFTRGLGGALVYTDDPDAMEVSNCEFRCNSASQGAAIYTSRANVLMVGHTVDYNEYLSFGPGEGTRGVLVFFGGPTTIRDSVVSNNTTTGGGGWQKSSTNTSSIITASIRTSASGMS